MPSGMDRTLFCLPANVAAVECLTGQTFTFAKRELRLALEGGSTACFKVISKN